MSEAQLDDLYFDLLTCRFTVYTCTSITMPARFACLPPAFYHPSFLAAFLAIFLRDLKNTCTLMHVMLVLVYILKVLNLLQLVSQQVCFPGCFPGCFPFVTRNCFRVQSNLHCSIDRQSLGPANWDITKGNKFINMVFNGGRSVPGNSYVLSCQQQLRN